MVVRLSRYLEGCKEWKITSLDIVRCLEWSLKFQHSGSLNVDRAERRLRK